MFKHLLRPFYFSKAERYGVTALLLLAMTAFLTPEIYRLLRPQHTTDDSAFSKQVNAYFSELEIPSGTPRNASNPILHPFDPNSASVADFVQLGLPERVAVTIAKYRDRGGRFRSADDLQKIYLLSDDDFERLRPYARIETTPEKPGRQAFKQSVAGSELFAFDPNTAPEADLLRLGLPRALVYRLIHYRGKGGFFFDKADVKKLYGFTEMDYARLEPYIVIAKSDLVVRPAAYAGGSGSGNPAPESVVDINAAGPEDWQRLPGIGLTRAYKIVRFRDKLGGFTAVRQVSETAGLPDSVFKKISSRLRVEAPVFRKMDINTVTVDEIAAHPYFTHKQAQLIVAFRDQHGRFSDVNGIDNIAAFTDKTWLSRIRPYLTVGTGTAASAFKINK